MATETTVTSAKAWAPDVSTFAASDAVPDALILTMTTVAGAIEGDEPVVRVAYVDDDEAQFTSEGAVIPEADPALNEKIVSTGKVTQLVRLSSEQYAQPGTATEIAESVRRAVTKKANSAFLTQAIPTAPAVTPPAGILEYPGLTVGAEVDGNLDALVDLLAELESNGASPSAILLDPLGWAALRKIKTETGAASALLGAGTSDAARVLLDLPVTVTGSMPANSGVVIDKGAIVSAVGTVQVASSEHVYFAADSMALRCTWRFGAAVVKPDRIGTFTVGA